LKLLQTFRLQHQHLCLKTCKRTRQSRPLGSTCACMHGVSLRQAVCCCAGHHHTAGAPVMQAIIPCHSMALSSSARETGHVSPVAICTPGEVHAACSYRACMSAVVTHSLYLVCCVLETIQYPFPVLNSIQLLVLSLKTSGSGASICHLKC